MRRTDSLTTALTPVRAALLAAARAEAERIRTEAESAAARTVDDAATAAARLRARARAQGLVDAAASVAAERARAGRHARAEVLRAHREGYESLRVAAGAAVSAVTTYPEYPRIRQKMIDIIHRLLGPDADLSDGTDGGVIGVVPGRRVDFSLAGFADHVVDAVAAQNIAAVNARGITAERITAEGRTAESSIHTGAEPNPDADPGERPVP